MKYAWIIGIVIVVVLIVWYFIGNKSEQSLEPVPVPFQPPFSDSGCSVYFSSNADAEAKISLMMSQIAANPEWMNDINNKINQSWHKCGGKTIDECKRMDAIYMLEKQGYCIPKNFV